MKPNHPTKLVTRRRLISTFVLSLGALSGCSSKSGSSERLASPSSTPSFVGTKSSTSSDPPEAARERFEEARVKLGEAFGELRTGNPWRSDGVYHMDRERSRQFDADRVQQLAATAHESIKPIQDDLANSSESMGTYWRIRAAAKLAKGAATQFQVVGEASSFYLDWTVAFDRENYGFAYDSIQRALHRSPDFWKSARTVENSLASIEKYGDPKVPNFKVDRWPTEQASMMQVWLRATEAFEGFRATTDGWRMYFNGERHLAGNRFDKAEHTFSIAGRRFKEGAGHFRLAFNKDLRWYDYRARELECRAPIEAEAMRLHEAAARAYGNGKRGRGAELVKKGERKRQEATDSCKN